MIKSITFENFKALREANLPLGRFTLIVGPNGSGKSTAVQAITVARFPSNTNYWNVVSAQLKESKSATASVKIEWAVDYRSLSKHRHKNSRVVAPAPSEATVTVTSRWSRQGNVMSQDELTPDKTLDVNTFTDLRTALESFKVFAFDADAIAKPVRMRPGIELGAAGENLAGVLENLRDAEPEHFETLNSDLKRWLPEFDRILFQTPSEGTKAFLLRTSVGGHQIEARDLSHGTLFALAFLTLTYLPTPPLIACFEEPDRGIHPRLLREIRDAMYRLAYPEDYGDKRKPIQVIATTHSPYMLDLYRDYPEEVVLAQKTHAGVSFERLSDKPNFHEILKGAPLGEVWYSGVLGGVPLAP